MSETEKYPKQGLVFPCSRAKRLVCWIWHRNGHWTAEEIADAKQRAAELRESLGWYDAPQQPMSDASAAEESGE